MRGAAILLSAAALSFADPSAHADDRTDFDAALPENRFDEAGLAYNHVLDAAIASRFAARETAAAGVLAARLALATGSAAFAEAFFAHAENLGARLDPVALLARADAAALLGKREDAEGRYRALLSSTDSAVNAAARIGLSRLTLVGSPRTVAPLLAPLVDRSGPHQWEALLISAIAASLGGDPATADALASRAWAAAADAPASEYATQRVAQARGAMALRRDDRDRAMAMLALTPQADGANAEIAGALADNAPLCGAQGIRADDFVTLALFRTKQSPAPQGMPIETSRAEVLPIFMAALDRSAVSAGLFEQNAAGPIVTIRCRTMVSSDMVDDRSEDQAARWFAAHNIFPGYFARTYYKSEDPLTAAASRFDAVEAKLGRDAPELAGMLYELAAFTAFRASSVGDVPASNAVPYYRRAQKLIRKVGGLDVGLPPGLDAEAIDAALAAAPDPAARKRLGQAYVRQWLAAAPFDLGYALMRRMPTGDDLSDADRLALIDIVLAKARNDPQDLRVAALFARKSAVQRALGDARGAIASLRKAGAAPDQCALQLAPPEFQSSDIGDPDYPLDLIGANQTGLTMFEFELDAKGKVSRHRVIASSPAGAFDVVLARKVGNIAYQPASDGRHAVACKAATQRVRWQLPKINASTDSVSPTFTGPTF